MLRVCSLLQRRIRAIVRKKNPQLFENKVKYKIQKMWFLDQNTQFFRMFFS